MDKFNEFLLSKGFILTDVNDNFNYFYTKTVEDVEFVYCLTAPHEGTKNRYLLRAEPYETFERWSIARFQRFYKDFDDFKQNLGKYLIFDEYDEMCN